VTIGDAITVSVTAMDKDPPRKRVTFDCRCVNQRGEVVIDGTAKVIAPTEKVRRPQVTLPTVRMYEHGVLFRELVDKAAALGPIRVQCRVVKPGRRVSTGTGLVWVTGLAAGTRVSWCAGAASTLAYSHDPWLYAVSCSMWPFLRTGNGLLPGCFRCPDREWPGAPGRLAVGSAGCPQGRETVPAGVARKRVWLPLLPLRWPRR
jgi:hypothetical protein